MSNIVISVPSKKIRDLRSALLDILHTLPTKVENQKLVELETSEICKTCEQPSSTFHNHHVVPIAVGGKDVSGNIIRICSECHAKIHSKHLLSTSALIKAGIARKRKEAEEEGRVWKCGRPPVSKELITEIVELRKQKKSIRAIERILGKRVSKSTISRVSKQYEEYCNSLQQAQGGMK